MIKHFKYLTKYLRNPKEGRSYCVGILGDKPTVAKFHQFWNVNGEDLMVASAYLLHEFVTSNTYTPTELAAYQKGVADVGNFFHSCYQEREIERLDSSLK
jgi:hypothetical protein